MFRELVSLTEKERQRIFSRKGRIKEGDYIYEGEMGTVYKVVYTNRQLDVYLLSSGEDQELMRREDIDYLRRIDDGMFSRMKKEWVMRNIVPPTIEGRQRFISSLLSSIYDRENFDVQIYEGVLKVIIRYPEIILRNSLGMTHTIRDLYFQVYIMFSSEGYVYVKDLKLARTTFEEREYSPEYGFYIFSHVKQTESPSALRSRTFCFGDTELKQFVSRLSNGVGVLELKKFFYAMNNYFQWESLEGNPYWQISRIGNGSYRPAGISDRTLETNKVFLYSEADKVIREMESFTFSFYMEGVRQMIQVTKVNDSTLCFEDFIENILSADFPDHFKCYMIGGVPVANYRSMNSEAVRGMNGRPAEFIFKGKTPLMRIIPDTNPDEIPEKVIHPVVISEIKEIIMEKFKTYLLLNNG